MLQRILRPALTLVCIGLLSACGEKPVESTDNQLSSSKKLLEAAQTDQPGPDQDQVSGAIAQNSQDLPIDQFGDDSSLSAIIGASEIPYPVYPNGSKYRVGGENGLKIVVFETADSFEVVDKFYRDSAGKNGMPRLIAMNDYVRYSRSDKDQDPWATFRPGIVIHEFADDVERKAVGADTTAKTNIIMSF